MPRRLGSTHAISIWDSQQRAGLGAASRTNPRTAPTSRMPFPGVASSPSHSQQPTPATQRAKRECGTVPLCWPQCAPSACHPSASRCLDPGVGVSCRGLCRVLVVGLSESEVQVHSHQRNAENDKKKKTTPNLRNNRQGISGEHDQEKPTIPPSGKTPGAPIMLPAVIALKGLLKLNSLVRNLGQFVAWLRRSCAVSRDAGRTTKAEGNAAKRQNISTGCMRDPSALAAGALCSPCWPWRRRPWRKPCTNHPTRISSNHSLQTLTPLDSLISENQAKFQWHAWPESSQAPPRSSDCQHPSADELDGPADHLRH